jgi:hypothetical protein
MLEIIDAPDSWQIGDCYVVSGILVGEPFVSDILVGAPFVIFWQEYRLRVIF